VYKAAKGITVAGSVNKKMTIAVTARQKPVQVEQIKLGAKEEPWLSIPQEVPDGCR
jgi:hypothetical protein